MPREDVVFIAFPRYSVQYEVHISMLPSARGRAGVKAAKKSVAYMWRATKARKLVGYIPTYNKAAVKFGHLVGFTTEGILTKSFKKDGKMHDMVILGLNREE
jgi:L-amino acid N-acyltransferase YncA